MANQNIDSLSIQIKANTQSASNSIKALEKNITALSKTLSGVSGASLRSLANGSKALSEAMQGFKGIDGRTFKSLASNMNKLGSINTANIRSLSTAMKQLTDTFNGIKIGGDVKAMSDLASSIAKLGYKNVTQAVDNIPRLSKALSELIQTLSNAPAVGNNVLRLVEALAKLTSALSGMGKSSSAVRIVSGSFDHLKRGASGLKNGFSKIGDGIKNSIGHLVRFAKEEEKASTVTSRFAYNIGWLYARFWMLRRVLSGLGNAIKSAMDYHETMNYFDKAFKQVADNAVEGWSDLGEESAKSYYNSFLENAKRLNEKLTGYTVNEQGMLESTKEVSLGLNPNTTAKYQAQFAQMASSMGVASEQASMLSQVLTEIGADLASVKDMDFEDVWEDMASGLTGMARTWDKYGVNIRQANLQQKLAELGINATVSSLSQADKAMLRTIVLLDSTRYAWGDLADTLDSPANQLRMLKSNFETLCRTIGGLFLPLVKKVLPYVNALVIALQRLMVAIGKFLGIDLSGMNKSVSSGSESMSDLLDETDGVGDALEEADEEAKKLKNHLLGIDELNILNENDSNKKDKDDNNGNVSDLLSDALKDAFDEYQKMWDALFASLENKAQELADKIEAWAKKVFAPIKEAWNATADYMKERWEHLKEALSTLFKDIARDMATVWAGEDIEKMFEAIFRTFGNVMEFVANIADGLDEAWNSSENGLHILENIAKIMRNIAEFVEELSLSWANWADTLNFIPLFESLVKLTGAVANNSKEILGIFLDFNNMFVQPVLKWIVETGLPRLNSILADLVDGINWEKLRSSLADVWDALSRIATLIGDKLLDVLQSMANTVKEFVNGNFFGRLGQDFQNLATSLENAKNLSDVIDAIFDFGDGRAFDLAQLVNSLTNWINEGFEKLDLKDALKTLGKRIGEQISILFKEIDFKELGKSFSNIIEGLGDLVTGALGNIDWFAVGQAIGDFLAGIDWLSILGKVAKAIGQALMGALEAWLGSLGEAPLETVLLTALGLGAGVSGLFKKISGNDDGLLKGALKSMLGLDKESSMFDVLTGKAKNATNAKGAFTDVNGDLNKSTITSAKGLLGEASSLSKLAYYAKGVPWFLMDIVGAMDAIDDATYEYKKQAKDGFSADSFVSIISDSVRAGMFGADTFRNLSMITEYGIAIKEILTNTDVWQIVKDWWDGIWNKGSISKEPIDANISKAFENLGIVEKLQDSIGNPIKTFFTETIPTTFSGLGESLSLAWENVNTTMSTKWDELQLLAQEKWEFIRTTVSDIWTNLHTSLGEKVEEIRTTFHEKWENIKTSVSDFSDKAVTTVKDGWSELKTNLGTIVDNTKKDIVDKWEFIKTKVSEFADTTKTNVTEKWNYIKEELARKHDEIKTNAIQKWTDIKTNIVTKATEIRDTISQRWDEMKTTASDKLEQIRSTIEGKWNEIKENFSSFITEWKAKITEWATQKWDEITDKIEEVKGQIKEKWDNLKQDFSDFILEWKKKITEWASQKWDEITDKVEEVRKAIYDKWQELKNNFSDFIKEWGEKITKWATDKWHEITDKVEEIRKAIYDKWEEAKQNFRDFIDDWKNKISEWASAKWDEIYDAMKELIKTIKEKWDNIVQDFKDFITEWKNKIKDWAQEKFDEVVNALRDIKEKILKKWDEIKADFANFITAWKNKISEWAQEKFDSVKQNFDNLKTHISGVWENIKTGASSFWSSFTSNLGSWASGAVASVSSAFQGLSGTLSGIWGGISSTASSALNSIGNTAQNVFSTVSNVASKVGNAVSNAYDTVSTAVGNAVSNVTVQLDYKKANVKSYATGGFPDGENGLFFANSGELVGKFTNGKTAVANNEQIVAGISQGVYNAVVRAYDNSKEEQLLEQLISAVKQGSKISIDGREIVNAYDSRKARNGYAF